MQNELRIESSAENVKIKTGIENSMEGYFETLELVSLKEKYELVSKEVFRLHSLNPLTKSGARKREAIPCIEKKQHELEEEYQTSKVISEKWLKNAFASKENKLKILLKFFGNIKYNNLQETIDELFPPTILPNPQKPNEGKSFPLYTASNLKQEMKNAWKTQIENYKYSTDDNL